MWSALKGAHGLGGVQEGFCQLHEMSGAWGSGGHGGPVAKGAWISPLTYISQLYPSVDLEKQTRNYPQRLVIKPNKPGKMVLGMQQGCVLPRLAGKF